MKRLKRLALATGLYRPARMLHRILFPNERAIFRTEVGLYSQFIRSGDLCFDIGANIGAKSEAMLSLGAKVISVEPQPELVRELRARFFYYGVRSVIVQSAIGDSLGKASLHLRDIPSHASLENDWQGQVVGELTVDVTTLDELIKRFGVPKFCKIDVEGYELKVLRGLSQPIETISIEYHTDDKCVTMARECIELLGKFGSMKLNFTAERASGLLLNDWMDASDFAVKFPECVQPNPFGDIIIRFA